ncbi:ANTAR domain-containing protein [Streptomyces sp. NPDC102279]|uniref:ANTAR domain-containing protein n=1 Tax=Streptomyces sp. NPDC102279 TaxID=3366153 RepID=UPI0038202C6D
MSVDTTGSKPTAPAAGEAVEQHMAELREENAQLQQAVHSHAVVDQAIGVILAVGKLAPDQGWNVLRALRQNTNTKLRHGAELLIEWARTGSLGQDIRTELERQLASCARTAPPDS